MVIFDYFNSVIDGIEFLMALGSIIGLLGVIIGLIGLIWGGKKVHLIFIYLFIFSVILLAFCGGYGRGLKYFHVH